MSNNSSSNIGSNIGSSNSNIGSSTNHSTAFQISVYCPHRLEEKTFLLSGDSTISSIQPELERVFGISQFNQFFLQIPREGLLLRAKQVTIQSLQDKRIFLYDRRPSSLSLTLLLRNQSLNPLTMDQLFLLLFSIQTLAIYGIHYIQKEKKEFAILNAEIQSKINHWKEQTSNYCCQQQKQQQKEKILYLLETGQQKIYLKWKKQFEQITEFAYNITDKVFDTMCSFESRLFHYQKVYSDANEKIQLYKQLFSSVQKTNQMILTEEIKTVELIRTDCNLLQTELFEHFITTVKTLTRLQSKLHQSKCMNRKDGILFEWLSELEKQFYLFDIDQLLNEFKRNWNYEQERRIQWEEKYLADETFRTKWNLVARVVQSEQERRNRWLSQFVDNRILSFLGFQYFESSLAHLNHLELPEIKAKTKTTETETEKTETKTKTNYNDELLFSTESNQVFCLFLFSISTFFSLFFSFTGSIQYHC
jgi:hypothetical protein